MTDDLESRLEAVLRTRAASITASDLPRRSVDELVYLTPSPAPEAAPRRAFAAAAVLVLVLGAVGGVVVSRNRQTQDTPVTAGPVATAAPANLRAWPLTNDEPLPGPTEEDPSTPAVVARAYLSEVVGLPADWAVDEPVTSDATAVVGYVLQDVPAQVSLARSEDGAWFVTAAATELARPSIVSSEDSGLDVAVAAGPRTYERGSRVRLSALAADGRVLDVVSALAAPTSGGAAAAATVASLRWTGAELAAVVRGDVLDDHDGDAGTPDAIVGHWTAPVATPSTASLPPGFDVLTAEPVFTTAGGPDDVADAYLRSRFPDHPAPGVRARPARTRGGRAFVRWSTADDVAGGTLFLREEGGSWILIASTTEGIDLSRIRSEDGRVRGRVTTTNINSLYADVLRPDGSPVPGAPRPLGQPGAAYRFATAAGPADGFVDLDVPIDGETPTLRVGLVGGTVLAVSECRIG